MLTPAAVLIFISFLIIYWLTRDRVILNNLLLFLFGFLLYSWGNLRQAMLLLLFLPFDYLLMRKMFQSKKHRSVGLCLGLFTNLLIWLGSRYTIGSVEWYTGSTLQIGTSFYILRKFSFLIAAFREKSYRDYSFLEYGLYISFFPQILSGPIERPKNFLEQVSHTRNISAVDWYGSVHLIIFGIFKKVVIADNVRVVVDRIFQLDQVNLILIYTGTTLFALQIFCDFSGYTDISRGMAGLLGFKTQKNFDNPFLAQNPQDFWSRWHISLTQWLQTHIFYPIRRCLRRKEYIPEWMAVFVATMITMIISGFWHGGSPKFIVWGLYHGMLLFLFRFAGIQEKTLQGEQKFHIGFWFVTSQLMLIGWLIFRSNDLGWLFHTISRITRLPTREEWIVTLSIVSQLFIFSFPLFINHLINKDEDVAQVGNPVFIAALAVILLLFNFSGFQTFIYAGF